MSAPEASFQKASHVRSLDGLRSLEDFIRDHGTTLVAIFHPLVPRWKRFSAKFEHIGEVLSNTGSVVNCVQINSVGNFDLVEKFVQKTYPTIVLCRASGVFKTYNGPLREDDILAFLARQDMPAITVDMDETSLGKIRRAHTTVIVAYLRPKEDDAVRHWITAIAKELRDDFVFCTSKDQNLARSEGVGVPGIVVYKHVPEEKSVLQDLSSQQAIRDFIALEVRPLVMQFLPELHEEMLEKTLPLGYIFVGTSAEPDRVAEDFLSVARRYRGRIQSGTVDVNDFPDLADTMHVTVGDEGLAFAILDPISNKKYPLQTGGNTSCQLTPGLVSIFVQDFLDGNLKPTIKSAPAPVVQSGQVVEVVGLTYEDIVMDPNRDVLVEFYTPWCGPCKALLPMYAELASLYASDERGRELVTIAKIDYEANDVPDQDVRGFPWFKLYPAGKKGQPLTYHGGRTVEAWSGFIAKNGTHKVVLALGKRT